MPTIKSLITTLQTYYDSKEEYVGEIMSTQEIVDQFGLNKNQASRFIAKHHKKISINDQIENLIHEESYNT
jgi:predicted metallopeptidase